MQKSWLWCLCLSALNAAPGFAVEGPDCASFKARPRADRELLATTARVLAGTATASEAASAGADAAAYAEHSAAMAGRFDKLEQRQMAAVRAFAAAELRPLAAAGTPVLYTFSGPDLLYPLAMFDDASAVLLSGLEPVGQPPDLAEVEVLAEQRALRQMRSALAALLDFSFFRTADMERDLAQPTWPGTVPLLLLFLAQGGYEVYEAEAGYLDADGRLCAGRASTRAISAARLGAWHPTRKQYVRVYYMQVDLADRALRAEGPYSQFVDRFAPLTSLLKAASYLPHKPHYSQVRELIARTSPLIVQDDTGLPVQWLTDRGFVVSAHGRYRDPIGIFRQFRQPALARLFADQPALNFSFGYRHRRGESALIVAREPGQATTASPP